MTDKYSSDKYNLDFEKWSALASDDPAAFEQRRQKLIDDFIMDLPEEKRQRMRCLQWRVDGVRRVSKTPLAACIEISRMMWESIKGENGLLEALNNVKVLCQLDGADASRLTLKPDHVADIIPFPRRAGNDDEFTPRDLL